MLSSVSSLKNFLSFLSSASIDELTSLPNIGIKRAQLILQLRRNGNKITLKSLSSLSGISSKFIGSLICGDHVTNIIDICNYVDSYYGPIKNPQSVVSLDLGLNEVGVAHVSGMGMSPNEVGMAISMGMSPNEVGVAGSMGMSLLEWKRVQLMSLRPYTPETCYEQVQFLFSQLPSASVYLIESQSHRPVQFNKGGFMDISLKLRLLEAITYTVATERGLHVCRVSPQKVGRYFNLESGKYSRKKQASVVMATHLLGVAGIDKVTTPLGVWVNVSNESLKDYFWKQRKMDDLSDSLLQGIAFLEWILLYSLVSNNDNNNND